MTAPALRTSRGSSNRICLLYNSFAWREAFGGSGVGCLFEWTVLVSGQVPGQSEMQQGYDHRFVKGV